MTLFIELAEQYARAKGVNQPTVTEVYSGFFLGLMSKVKLRYLYLIQISSLAFCTICLRINCVKSHDVANIPSRYN